MAKSDTLDMGEELDAYLAPLLLTSKQLNYYEKTNDTNDNSSDDTSDVMQEREY